MTTGIISAMREEVVGLVAELACTSQMAQAGMRTYLHGTLWGVPVVLAFSRWGKVAAATTATSLIERFGVQRVVFTGVAGAVDPALAVGDVVVADRLRQHDLDASPLFPRHEVPLLGLSSFPTDPALRQAVLAAAERFLARDLAGAVPPEELAELGIARPCAVVATWPAATTSSPRRKTSGSCAATCPAWPA
jgi:adenosylhomocysteine nucleosidase